MGNLAGHDLPSLLDAFAAARTHDRPVCFICYTIKGFGLPLAGHKDNHAGLMNPAQVETLRAALGVRPGHEWDRFEGLRTPPDRLEAFLAAVPFNAQGARRFEAPRIPVPDALPVPPGRETSTQHGFGLLMHDLARGDTELARRVVTTSPDVTVSTNLGAWVKPPRPVRARGTGGRVPHRTHPVHLPLAVLAARASTSSSASRR